MTLTNNTQLYSDPAVAGLAGFGLSSLLLQFFNLGWIDEGPAIYIGAIFGGFVQLIAGFQFLRLRDNFGYAVFISYGAFWITLPLILVSNHFGLFVSTSNDIAVLISCWALLSILFTIVAAQKNLALFLLFACVVLGMVTSVLGNKGIAIASTISAILFIGAALVAWYIMLSNLLKEQIGRDVLPLGRGVFQLDKKE
ncbi:acetate uptake transporter [Tenacibaculum amylolyticum]|uniref:acetate uptake transporter n=1 Tax=Tenacibaculum amylolyticum TaxID=104269 RepID=UPI003893D344